MPAPYILITNYILEQHQIAFTQLRTVPHKFRIETGQSAHLPKELRTCPCGDAQDEEQVLTKCPWTLNFRNGHYSLNNLFRDDLAKTAIMIYNILDYFS